MGKDRVVSEEGLPTPKLQQGEAVVVIKISPVGHGREYTFYGEWTGKGVRAAIAGLFRAYRKHLANVRKLADTTNGE